MRTRTLVPCFAVFVAACGGAGTAPAGVGGPDLASPAVSAFDRAITLPSFDILPGQEKTMCAYVPSDGVERWINAFQIDMAAGSHHLLAYRISDDGGPARGPESCNVGIPAGMLPGAQQPHTMVPLLPGMAMKIGATDALYFQMHYINATTTDTITAKVTYKMKGMAAADVKQTAGELFYGIWQLNIPVGASVSALKCSAPSDFNLLLATGHMHKHGTAFDATIGTNSIYHTDNWDQPGWSAFTDPGLAVKAGDSIGWACSYNNQTGGMIHFGDSAEKNEMCILTGIYYPAPNSQSLFLCQK